MLASDRDDHVAEASAVEIDQGTPVLIFLCGHAVEDGGRGRIGIAQLRRVDRVDAAVLLF